MRTQLEVAGLSGAQKAATLLIALGPELSAQVLKAFSESEIEWLTNEILAMQAVKDELKGAVLEEVYEATAAERYLAQGGLSYARELLERSFGAERARELLDRVVARRAPQPFDFIRDTDPAQLASFLEGEHPQTIAVILAHLDPSQAAAVLDRLPPTLQGEVAHRLASMDRTAPEVVRELAQALRKKLWGVLSHGFSQVGGLEYLVQVLNKTSRQSERTILEWLDASDQALAEEIRKKMFVFENLAQLDDLSLQRVLREVDPRDLAMALKVASEDLKARVFANLSSRAADGLREDISLLGPLRLSQVEEARSRIVETVRRLERAEEIVIQRSGEDTFV